MPTVTQSAVASNLSYVLHEPSTSTVVRSYVSGLRRERERINAATRRLGDLTDDEFGKRVICVPGSPLSHHGSYDTVRILSVRVGAWQLLSRALQVSGLLPDPVTCDITFIDDPDSSSTEAVEFFRAPAHLHTSITDAVSPEPRYFASAVYRPGLNTILVRLNSLAGVTNGEIDQVHHWLAVSQLAEKTVREFVLQWCCERSLWDRPAEETLPEFRQ